MRRRKAQELLGAVTRQTFADGHAGFDIERREQRGCPVALVIVRHRCRRAFLERKVRLAGGFLEFRPPDWYFPSGLLNSTFGPDSVSDPRVLVVCDCALVAALLSDGLFAV